MAATSSLLVASVFLGVFPACYVEGSGLTLFKIASEYVICLLFGLAMAAFYVKRGMLDSRVLMLIIASLAFSIAAELSFTNYVSVYGSFNALGHLLRLVSVLLIYVAIVEMAVSRPVATLFRRISDSEKRYRSLLDTTPSLVIVLNDSAASRPATAGWRKQCQARRRSRSMRPCGHWTQRSCPRGCMRSEPKGGRHSVPT
jgi:hypothetical protein